jgi:hypothetical protein
MAAVRGSRRNGRRETVGGRIEPPQLLAIKQARRRSHVATGLLGRAIAVNAGPRTLLEQVTWMDREQTICVAATLSFTLSSIAFSAKS